MRNFHAAFWALLLFVAGCARACAKPEAPTMTPHRATLTQIGATGIDFALELGVRNPNRVDLSARSVTARVIVDGRYDLGTTTVPQAFALPAANEVLLTVPLSVQWKDVAALTALTLSNRDVPYTVEGVVTLGGDLLHLDLPFRMAGLIARDDLVRAAMRSLPALPLPLP